MADHKPQETQRHYRSAQLNPHSFEYSNAPLGVENSTVPQSTSDRIQRFFSTLSWKTVALNVHLNSYSKYQKNCLSQGFRR